MKALIFNDEVVDVAETEFEVAPTLTWMDAPEGCKQGWSLDDGVLVAPPAAPEPSYNKKRQNEYPNFGDQFDLLWHAIDTGNWTVEKLKTTDFYTKLKKVKDDNPKS